LRNSHFVLLSLPWVCIQRGLVLILDNITREKIKDRQRDGITSSRQQGRVWKKLICKDLLKKTQLTCKGILKRKSQHFSWDSW